MGRWTGLALAGLITGGQAVAVIEKGVDGWTVFSAFVVGALIVQSFYGWVIDAYRARFEECRQILEGVAEGRLEITIEEVTEDGNEVPVDHPRRRGSGSGG